MVIGFKANALLNEFGKPEAIEFGSAVFAENGTFEEIWLYEIGFNRFPIALGMKQGTCITAKEMSGTQYRRYRDWKYAETRNQLLGQSQVQVERLLGGEVFFPDAYSLGPAGVVKVKFQGDRCVSTELLEITH